MYLDEEIVLLEGNLLVPGVEHPVRFWQSAKSIPLYGPRMLSESHERAGVQDMLPCQSRLDDARVPN